MALAARRPLVSTGVMLGLVLLVMVGEHVEEMQLARWLPTTPLRGVSIPADCWAVGGSHRAGVRTGRALALRPSGFNVDEDVSDPWKLRPHAGAHVSGDCV
jgi:hypothetical protein